MQIGNKTIKHLYLDLVETYFKDIDKLILSGMDINSKYTDGNTFFMLAIIHRNICIAERFLNKYPVSVFIQNNEGKDAIDLAVQWGNSLIMNKIKRKALSETKKMSHDDIFNIATEIISNITGIPSKHISPVSHMEYDLKLYEENSYLLPEEKIQEFITKIEHRFRIDSRKMDPKYRMLFDRQIKGQPTVWKFISLIKDEIDIRKKITV